MQFFYIKGKTQIFHGCHLIFTVFFVLLPLLNVNLKDPPEQGGVGGWGGGESSAPLPNPVEIFLSMCSFSRIALEVLFLIEGTKNVHEINFLYE